MKLSMWMLADALAAHPMRVEVREGQPILQNARMLVDGAHLSRYTAYLSQTTSDRISIMNGRDMITVEHDDVHELLDEVLDVFEDLNEWSNSLYEQIRDDLPLESLLRSFNERSGLYYIISDATAYVLGRYGNMEDTPDDELFRDALSQDILPTDVLVALASDPGMHSRVHPTAIVSAPEVHSTALRGNLFFGSEPMGWLTAFGAQGCYTEGQLQLHDEMRKMADAWLAQSRERQNRFGIASMFADILNDAAPDRLSVLDRFAGFSWQQDDAKVLYAVRAENPEMLPALARSLERSLPESFVFMHQRNLLLLGNLKLSGEAALEQELSQFLVRYGCSAGKSRIFHDVFDLRAHYRATLVAAEYAQGVPGGISSAREAALPYCRALLSEHAAMEVSHPAIGILRAYDEEHATELLHTLETFLRSNHSYKACAEALFVHRTTLMYRLERIAELTGLDLDDYDTQLHLGISFLVMED